MGVSPLQKSQGRQDELKKINFLQQKPPQIAKVNFIQANTTEHYSKNLSNSIVLLILSPNSFMRGITFAERLFTPLSRD